jgi:hypothetical protein
MAITTFDELKTAAANWLGRDDLTDRIPEFIALAEGRMNRTIFARAQEVRATATLVADDAYTALPTDLRTIRAVQLNTTPTTVLRFMPPSQLERTYPSTASGKPLAYAVIGGEIKWAPTPDSGYTAEILYTQGIPALSDSQTNNTYLLRSPDAYLYGTLVEAHRYLMDPAQANNFDQLFGRAMSEMKAEDDEARWGGSPLLMKTASAP